MAKKPTEMEFRWKPGTRCSGVCPAAVAATALEKIRKANKGELESQTVVDAAKGNRHALHRFFEWDDSTAAHEHRCEQARLLIRSIEVIRSDEPDKPTRQYEVARAKFEPRRNVYRSIDDIMADPEMRADLLQRALGELLSMRRKYVRLQELSIVFREVDVVLETLSP